MDLTTGASSNVEPVARWHTGLVQLRCVIVDDDEPFLDVARAFLEQGGLIIAGTARSSAEAVQCVQAVRPDVVLIDIRLGEESGFETARQLADSGQSAALIMISNHAGADYARVIAGSPAVGFLPKTQLSAAAVHRLLEGSPACPG